jgi:uncharacterized membrane protein
MFRVSRPGNPTGSEERLNPNRRREMATVSAEIDVAVPVSTAYDQWTQFEDFPRFMSGVVDVRQIDDALTHWVAEVNGSSCRNRIC